MKSALFDSWRDAAQKATLAERLVFDKTAAARLPHELPTQAEMAAAVLLRLRAADLLQQLIRETELSARDEGRHRKPRDKGGPVGA